MILQLKDNIYAEIVHALKNIFKTLIKNIPTYVSYVEICNFA